MSVLFRPLREQLLTLISYKLDLSHEVRRSAILSSITVSRNRQKMQRVESIISLSADVASKEQISPAPPSRKHVIAGVALLMLTLVGLSFRFWKPEHREFWHDEAHTALVISGHTFNDAVALFDGKLRSATDVLSYQLTSPQVSDADVISAVRATRHPPLFYILLKHWATAAGSDVFHMRLFCVLVSLFQPITVYLLCRELFHKRLLSLFAATLTAISPYLLFYSQDAREYGLLFSIIAGLSALFLSCLRSAGKSRWLLYSLAVAISLYVSLITLSVIASHGLFLIIRERLKLTGTVTKFFLAIGVALLLFSPWLAVVRMGHAASVPGWMLHAEPSFRSNMPRLLCSHFTSLFFSHNPNLGSSISHLLSACVLGIEILAFYLCFRRTNERSMWFLMCLMIVPLTTTVFPDLVLGGLRSSAFKYMMPTIVGAFVACAYGISLAVACNQKLMRQTAWAGLLVILGCAVSTDIQLSESIVDQKAQISRHSLTRVADVINADNSPVLIVSTLRGVRNSEWVNPCQILALSHRLKPQCSIQLLKSPQLPSLPRGAKYCYLFDTDPALTDFLRMHGYRLTLISSEDCLATASPPPPGTTDLDNVENARH